MSGDEISDLALLLPAPAARDLPVERAREVKGHMLAEFRRETATTVVVPRRHWVRRSRLAALAGACAVGVASGAGVLIAGVGSSPGGATPQAAALLAKIAYAAGRQPSQHVRDGEFMYIRSEVAFAVYTGVGGHQTMTMAAPHERQVWLPVANLCTTGLLIEDGQSTPLSAYPVANGKVVPPPPGSHFAGCGKGSLNDPTYRLLQSLPTDPRALLSLIYAQTQGEGQAQGPDGEAFTTIGDLIREMIVPPRTAAALYRAAALIPGVTLAGRTTNAAGQTGVAIAYTDSGGRDEWIFDPVTLQFIGERDSDPATGAVSGDTAILQRAFVEKAGQLPGGR